MKLVEGKGNEGDTLKDKSIYVYDTKSFPFYPGEVKSVTPVERGLATVAMLAMMMMMMMMNMMMTMTMAPSAPARARRHLPPQRRPPPSPFCPTDSIFGAASPPEVCLDSFFCPRLDSSGVSPVPRRHGREVRQRVWLSQSQGCREGCLCTNWMPRDWFLVSSLP
jgi:hypothetical protein